MANQAPGAGPRGSGSLASRRLTSASAGTWASSSTSRPDAEARMPIASNPARRRIPGPSRSTRNEPMDCAAPVGDGGLSDIREARGHEREAQGRQPGRPGLLAGQPPAVAARVGRRHRAGMAPRAGEPPALLGRGVVDQGALADDRAIEALARRGRPSARIRDRTDGVEDASRSPTPSSRRPHRARRAPPRPRSSTRRGRPTRPGPAADGDQPPRAPPGPARRRYPRARVAPPGPGRQRAARRAPGAGPVASLQA